MLGHRDPRSTRRYAEVNEDQVRAALSGETQGLKGFLLSGSILRDVINIRTIFVGLLGGALSALALVPPLYFILPASVSLEWTRRAKLGWVWLDTGSPRCLSLLVGYVAVQLSHIRKVAAGAAAGTLAGSIAWLLIGTSASWDSRSAPVLNYGLHRANEIDLLRLLVECLVRLPLITFISFILFFIIGAF